MLFRPRAKYAKQRAWKESAYWAIMGVAVLVALQFLPAGVDIPRGMKQFLLAPLLAFAFHYGAFLYGYETRKVSLQAAFFFTLISFIVLASFKLNYWYFAYTDNELALMCLVIGGSYYSGAMNGATCRDSW